MSGQGAAAGSRSRPTDAVFALLRLGATVLGRTGGAARRWSPWPAWVSRSACCRATRRRWCWASRRRRPIGADRGKLGLDRPLGAQYLSFLLGLARLHWGDSLARPGTSAFAEVGRALGPTSALAGLAVGLGALLGIAAAVACVGPWLGSRREWLHRAVLVVAATPLLSFAPLATYLLAVRLRVVPLPGDPESGASGLLFASRSVTAPRGAGGAHRPRGVARFGPREVPGRGRGQGRLTLARVGGACAARGVGLHPRW